MVEGYSNLIYVAVALGIAKGVRTVYMGLVIPSYVPIDKLANASGLQMLVNGIFILIGGPIMGKFYFYSLFFAFILTCQILFYSIFYCKSALKYFQLFCFRFICLIIISRI